VYAEQLPLELIKRPLLFPFRLFFIPLVVSSKSPVLSSVIYPRITQKLCFFHPVAKSVSSKE
jgi:hypothetical protein